MRTLAAALSLSLLVIGCGQKEDSAEIKEIKLQRLARDYVQKNIKDPESAQFRNQYDFLSLRRLRAVFL
jgi:hypothetical protein